MNFDEVMDDSRSLKKAFNLKEEEGSIKKIKNIVEELQKPLDAIFERAGSSLTERIDKKREERRFEEAEEAYSKKGDYDSAISCYKKAIELDPDNAVNHNNLGLAYHRKGDDDLAIPCYKEAIKLDPNCVLAHNNLGLAYHRKGDDDLAVSFYKEAIKLDPNCVLAHNYLGLAYHRKGEYDLAVSFYKEAIKLDPNCVLAHNYLGLAYHRLSSQGRR